MVETANKPVDRWLSLIALAVGVALYLLPKTETVIIGCCILIWGSLIHPFIKFWWVEDRKWRQWLAAAILTVGVVYLGYTIKPEKSPDNQAKSRGEESQPAPALAPTKNAPTSDVKPLPPEPSHKRAKQTLPRRDVDVSKFPPAGYVTFLGQVINGWAPVMQVNQTETPLDDVHLSVMQSFPDTDAQFDSDSDFESGTSTVGWQKEIEIGTCRARLSIGLADRFPVGGQKRIRFDILHADTSSKLQGGH